MALHLQAALNGDRSKSDHENIPVTIPELAEDSIRVVKAGAGSIHIHPRNSAFEETLDPDVVAITLLKIKSEVKVPIGISTAEWIEGPRTLDMIRNWTVLPDFASVNIHEERSSQIISLLQQKGIGVEAGIWTTESALKFIGLEVSGCLRVLIEPMENNTAEAINNARSIISALRKKRISTPLLLHGQNDSAWKILAFARALGLGSRIGFEDTLKLPDGSNAQSNRELVIAASKF